MIVLTTDRINGVGVDNTALSSYGPGNMLDESNRNSWVSGSMTDKVTLTNNAQVSALFLGRFQSDSVKFSYLGKDLFPKIPTAGKIVQHDTRVYVDGNTTKLGDVSFNQTVSTGDAVRVTGSDSNKANINAVGTATLKTITVIGTNNQAFYYTSDTANVDTAVDLSTIVAETGANGSNSFTITGNVAATYPVGMILKWTSVNTVTMGQHTAENDDLQFTTTAVHGLAVGDLVRFSTTGTLPGYVKADETPVGALETTIDFIVVSVDAENKTFKVGIPEVQVTNPIDHHATSDNSGAGTGTHYVKHTSYGFVKTATVDTNTIITVVDIDGTALNFKGDITTAGHSSLSYGMIHTSAVIEPYINDDSDSLVTGTAGTILHRQELPTRVYNSLGNFTRGVVTQVKTAFIPLPKEVESTTIELDFITKHNRSGGDLMQDFLLESETVSGTEYTINSFNYNESDTQKGILEIVTSGNAADIAVGDYVTVNLPTSDIFPVANGAQLAESGVSGQTYTVASTNNLYEGMQVNKDSSAGADKGTINNIISATTFSVIGGAEAPDAADGLLSFGHPAGVASDADKAFSRVHRVVGKPGNATTLQMYAPNYGNNGDLTRVTSTTFAGSAVADNTPTQIYTTGAKTIQKVTEGTGRFVRDIKGQTSIAGLTWDASATGGTATATFTSSHGLVNNDKIILFNLSDAGGGGDKMVNLAGSYLVTYSTDTTVTFNIVKANQRTLTSLTASGTTITGITSADHGFVKGDKVDVYGSASTSHYDKLHTIVSVPTSKSFTFTHSASATNPDSTAGMKVTGGVHYRNGATYYDVYTTPGQLTVVPCRRTISIEDSKDFNLASGAGEPLQVGNLLWIDGWEESSSKYSGTTYDKTPEIQTATETPHTSENAVTDQKTFVAPWDEDDPTISTYDGVTLNGDPARNNSPVGQITRIKGDGTGFGDVTISPPVGKLNGPLNFTSLRHGILVGIIRAGTSIQFPNPQVGVNNTFKDYSVRKDLATGSYYFLNRDSAKQFSGKIIGAPDTINPFIDFGQTQLAKPFACLVISGTGANMRRLRLRAAVYGYFTALPSASFSNKLNNLKNISFNIKEVL